jgi:hypothetical protein
MKWRCIYTDTESMTGVAPECEDPDHPADDAAQDTVYECCPHPHLQVWNEREATTLMKTLNAMDVEVCT